MGQALTRPFADKAHRLQVDNRPEKTSLPYYQQNQRPTVSEHVAEQRREDRCNIQPHTDDGGDAYYIGDAYEPARLAHEWAIDTRGKPYLEYVKRISKTLPHLEYLAHWMEVSAAPPKWKFIKEYPANRDRRARRCNACVVDFGDGSDPSKKTYNNTTSLDEALNAPPQKLDKPSVRLVVVEDLSRDLVELLGAKYDIDPLFFLSHIGDYLFHNTRDRWVELPDLDFLARERPHFNLQYLRARYFKTPESFAQAERESGAFNVLRRLDSDRSSKRLQNGLLDVNGACVTLTRAKTSLWVRPRTSTDDDVLAILLVDPTVSNGDPLWGGYRPFEDTPSMRSSAQLDTATRTTLFEDVVHWSTKLSRAELDTIRNEIGSKSIALPMIRLVIADWRTVLKYMSTMLGKIEWEFERPHWGERPSDVDESLRKLSPWRRNIPYYQTMISEAVDRLFLPLLPEMRNKDTVNPVNTPTPKSGLLSLLYDYRNVQQLMDANQKRIETIQTMATNSINIEESRRAVQQNQNLARLTFLATIFIPLNFTSSFLSMSPDFSAATQTIWMFFAIGFPLTLFALVIVDISHPQEGILARKWKALTTASKPNPPPPVRQTSERIQVGATMPWSITRLASGLNSKARI